MRYRALAGIFAQLSPAGHRRGEHGSAGDAASGGPGARLDDAFRVRGPFRPRAGGAGTEHADLYVDRLARRGIPRCIGRDSLAVRAAKSVELCTSRTWHRFPHARWRSVVQRGLTPVTVGLVMAAATLLTEATSADWAKGAVTSVTAAVSWCRPGCIPWCYWGSAAHSAPWAFCAKRARPEPRRAECSSPVLVVGWRAGS